MFALVSALTGCVQRRLTIRSDPPGARVYVGDEEIGTTPVATDFIYYGTRKLRLVKDGYETLVVNQPVPAPWYQYFPLDFVTENVIPGEIRDERVVNYQLVPQQAVSTDQLLSRGEQLRRSNRSEQVLPVDANVIVPGAGQGVGGQGPGGMIFSPPPAQNTAPFNAQPPFNLPQPQNAPQPYNPPQYLPPG